MSAASLSLLKGGKKAALEEELEDPKGMEIDAQVDSDVSAEVEAESVELNPDEMSGEEIEAVAKEFGLKLPANFAKLNLDQKREWLKSQAEPEESVAAQVDKPEEADAGPVIKDGDVIETVSPENPTQSEKVKEVHDKADKKGKKKVEPEIKQGGGLVTPLTDQTDKAVELKPAKETKKSGAKKTATEVSTQVAKEGEIVQDMIIDIVHEIETMNEKDARAVVATLADQTEKTFFKLGGVLSVIQANSWFQPYGTFRDYVEKEHGIQYRRAMYWISIYNKLVESKVPWYKVKELGWTKLKVVAEILTEENVDEWVSIAKSQTVLQLVETVKAAASPEKLLTADADTAATTTKTFKVHPGQKETIEAAIQKAKEASNTTVDTVALENICLDYIAAPSLTQRLKTAGLEAALKALEGAFPQANFTVELPEAE